MPQALDFDSDQFLRLLTDALRAGPGSPSWHQAMQQLESAGGNADAADQYRLIASAREHLESGKAYRSIRPGPLFTRRVMERIEAAANGDASETGRRFSPATWIAVLAAVAGLAAVAAIAWLLSSAAEKPPITGIPALEMQSFTRSITASFHETIPNSWLPIGILPVKPDKGLRPILAAKGGDQGGGGIYRNEPISPSQPCEVDLKINYTSGSGVVPEFFITDQPTFSDNRTGTSPHELVWTLLNDRPQVQLPDQTFVAAGPEVSHKVVIPVKIRFDSTYAIVDTGLPAGGSTRWAGPHQLSPDHPRFVGIRFLVRNTKSDHDVWVESFQLNQP